MIHSSCRRAVAPSAIAALIGLIVPHGIAPAAPVKGLIRVGQCARTAVRSVSTRLAEGNGRPVPGSGSSVRLANGVYGVNYDQVAAVDASRRGDPVLACLVKLPTHCPPGDDRGRWYTVTNLRTLESWTLPDAQHMCGGA